MLTRIGLIFTFGGLLLLPSPLGIVGMGLWALGMVLLAGLLLLPLHS